jgi:hypothetical protein
VTSVGNAAGNDSGTLVVHLAVNNNVLPSGSALTLTNGATLIVLGSSGTSSQSLGALTVGGADNSLVVNGNGGPLTSLVLGNTWNRAAAGTLNITLTNSGVLTSSPSSTNGILSFVTVNDGSDTGFAQVSGGNIVRLSGQGTAAFDGTDSATANLKATNGSFTLSAANGMNSLTLDTSGGALNLNLAGFSQTISSGGLLMTGSSNAIISDTIGTGLIGGGATGASELIVQQYGTGVLTISSLIGR